MPALARRSAPPRTKALERCGWRERCGMGGAPRPPVPGAASECRPLDTPRDAESVSWIRPLRVMCEHLDECVTVRRQIATRIPKDESPAAQGTPAVGQPDDRHPSAR